MLHKKDFRPRKKSQEEIEELAKRNLNVFKNIQNSKEYTLEEKAENYHSSILWFYECLLQTQESVRTYPIKVYQQSDIKEVDSFLVWAANQAKLKITQLREKQKAVWEEYFKAESKEAKAFISQYGELQKEIEGIIAGYIEPENKNLKKVYLSVVLNGVTLKIHTHSHITTHDRDRGSETKITSIMPKETKAIKDFLPPLYDLKPFEAVSYYERRLKGRLVENVAEAKKPYALFLDAKEEALSLVDITKGDFMPLGIALPKAKELENFDWTLLD